ncbi:hypothetical protein NB2BOR_A03600 [Bordetella parapertussis]|nr:hypothetical protein NB2BOR_A03600 [Bordetella parapertussis]
MGRDIGVGRQCAVGHRHPQALLERGLDAVVDVVDALLQPVVLGHQRVAGQYAGDAAIALGERQQHGDGLARLAHAIGLGDGDLVDHREDAGFDELDQPFEHLRLAGEMAVQGGLGHLHARGQGRGGDACGVRLFEHLRKRMQDLGLSLAGFARHGRA